MLPARSVAETILSQKPDIRLTKTSRDVAVGITPLPKGRELYVKIIIPIAHLLDAETNQKLISDVSFIDQVRVEMISVLKEREVSERKKSLSAGVSRDFNESIKCPIDRLLYIRDVTDESGILYDPQSDTQYPYSTALAENTLRRKLGKEGFPEWLDTNERQCYIQYVPFEKRMFQSPVNGHWIFNQWSAPAYQKDWAPDPGVTSLPAETEKFFRLFSPEHRDLIMCWLRDAIFSKADPILVLRGAAGCGKNMFADYLTAELLGKNTSPSNFVRARRDFASSRFNAYIGRTQLLVFDEVRMSFDLKETLKDLHNGIQTLEDKFQKIMGTSTVYFSAVVITNHRRNITVDFDDRKFFIPSLGVTNLRNLMGLDWIHHLVRKEWKDHGTLRQIASYLYHRVPHQKVFPIETPHFMELCWLNSLPEYFKRFLTLAVDHKEFQEGVFHKKNNRNRPEIYALEEQMIQFQDNKKLDKPVGHFIVSRETGKWKFVSNIYGREDLVVRSPSVIYDDAQDDGSDGDVEL